MGMKSVVIIGAGIAGLSAGVYARKNGYRTRIFESHSAPGGMCTSWKRKGYTFDGSLHWIGLVGSAPTHVYYDVWRELGVFPGLRVIDRKILQSFRDASGRELTIYADADALAKELRFLSPQDSVEIEALRRAVKAHAALASSVGKNPFRMAAKALGILYAIPLLKKYGSMDMVEYAARFKDPLIRFGLANLFACPRIPCTMIFFFLAGLHLGASGFPEGGSIALTSAIERTFLGLGGEISYKTRVERILTEDGRAAGVRLEDGRIERADIVISAADARATLNGMLDAEVSGGRTRERLETNPLFPPFIQVSLGVDMDLSGSPHFTNALLPEPVIIAGAERTSLYYGHLAFDKTMAPRGKSSVLALFPSDYDWWNRLGYRSAAYEAEKRRTLEATVSLLERFLPGISQRIESSDVATPCSSFRYTNNWKGALGFMMDARTAGEMLRERAYELPGLKDFYMAGQWTRGLGVPMAAQSARDVVKRICAAEGRKFMAG
jgi:phytoene dehydrogenase-like protein